MKRSSDRPKFKVRTRRRFGGTNNNANYIKRCHDNKDSSSDSDISSELDENRKKIRNFRASGGQDEKDSNPYKINKPVIGKKPATIVNNPSDESLDERNKGKSRSLGLGERNEVITIQKSHVKRSFLEYEMENAGSSRETRRTDDHSRIPLSSKEQAMASYYGIIDKPRIGRTGGHPTSDNADESKGKKRPTPLSSNEGRDFSRPGPGRNDPGLKPRLSKTSGQSKSDIVDESRGKMRPTPLSSNEGRDSSRPGAVRNEPVSNTRLGRAGVPLDSENEKDMKKPPSGIRMQGSDKSRMSKEASDKRIRQEPMLKRRLSRTGADPMLDDKNYREASASKQIENKREPIEKPRIGRAFGALIIDENKRNKEEFTSTTAPIKREPVTKPRLGRGFTPPTVDFAEKSEEKFSNRMPQRDPVSKPRIGRGFGPPAEDLTRRSGEKIPPRILPRQDSRIAEIRARRESVLKPGVGRGFGPSAGNYPKGSGEKIPSKTLSREGLRTVPKPRLGRSSGPTKTDFNKKSEERFYDRTPRGESIPKPRLGRGFGPFTEDLKQKSREKIPSRPISRQGSRTVEEKLSPSTADFINRRESISNRRSGRSIGQSSADFPKKSEEKFSDRMPRRESMSKPRLSRGFGPSAEDLTRKSREKTPSRTISRQGSRTVEEKFDGTTGRREPDLRPSLGRGFGPPIVDDTRKDENKFDDRIVRREQENSFDRSRRTEYTQQTRLDRGIRPAPIIDREKPSDRIMKRDSFPGQRFDSSNGPKRDIIKSGPSEMQRQDRREQKEPQMKSTISKTYDDRGKREEPVGRKGKDYAYKERFEPKRQPGMVAVTRDERPRKKFGPLIYTRNLDTASSQSVLQRKETIQVPILMRTVPDGKKSATIEASDSIKKPLDSKSKADKKQDSFKLSSSSANQQKLEMSEKKSAVSTQKDKSLIGASSAKSVITTEKDKQKDKASKSEPLLRPKDTLPLIKQETPKQKEKTVKEVKSLLDKGFGESAKDYGAAKIKFQSDQQQSSKVEEAETHGLNPDWQSESTLTPDANVLKTKPPILTQFPKQPSFDTDKFTTFLKRVKCNERKCIKPDAIPFMRVKHRPPKTKKDLEDFLSTQEKDLLFKEYISIFMEIGTQNRILNDIKKKRNDCAHQLECAECPSDSLVRQLNALNYCMTRENERMTCYLDKMKNFLDKSPPGPWDNFPVIMSDFNECLPSGLCCTITEAITNTYTGGGKCRI